MRKCIIFLCMIACIKTSCSPGCVALSCSITGHQLHSFLSLRVKSMVMTSAFANAHPGRLLSRTSAPVLRAACARRKRFNAPCRRATPVCVWVERSATVLIEIAAEEAYDYYIDLEAMPKW